MADRSDPCYRIAEEMIKRDPNNRIRLCVGKTHSETDFITDLASYVRAGLSIELERVMGGPERPASHGS